MRMKSHKNEKITVVFFGDGAIDEGVFWEFVNIACLMKLPIIFVCEDNGLAVHTSPKFRHGYNSITEIISKFNCIVKSSDTTDVEKIYALTVESINDIKNFKKPVFLHLKYYRYLEHVGVNEDFKDGYRSFEEFKMWQSLDPIKLQRDKLLTLNIEEKTILIVEKTIEELARA